MNDEPLITDYRQSEEIVALTTPTASTRSPRWLNNERPYTPARGSDPYLVALTQLANRLGAN